MIRSYTKRIVLLLILPLLWSGTIYLTQRPVDTRTKDGIELTMEEPLGNWRHDEALSHDCPAQADSIRTNATGDRVYEVRTAYFHRVILRQAGLMFLITLLVILLHDTILYLQRRRGRRKQA